MLPHLPSLLTGLIVAGISTFHPTSAQAKTPITKEETKKAVAPSTLSELGIDFGAAELGRYAELNLSGDQRKQALNVVNTRKPRIEKLCDRMTKALAMGESTLEKKRLKETELAAILAKFKEVQAEIIDGLHALVTEEQMAKLESMKKEELQKALETEKQRAGKTEASS